MALDPVVNFFQTEIATLPVASGGTSIVITTGDGAKLPDPAVDGNFNLTIYNEDDPFDAPEIVRVTAIAGDTLTVTRAQEGTSATNKTSGNTWYLELTPTAKTIQDIDTAKLNVADVVNNLTSTDTDKALSANQGKVLQDNKEPADATILKQADVVNTLVSTSTTAPLSANQGKVLQDGKLNLSGGTMTGDLTIPDKIIHSGDTNTAIRFPANDTVTVETSGVEAIRVANNQRVGIRVVPEYGLHSLNEIASNSFIEARKTGSVAGNFGEFRIGNSVGNFYGVAIRAINESSSPNFHNPRLGLFVQNNNTVAYADLVERLSITSAGNVGIGTTSPATKLDVNGSIRTSTGILFGTDTAGANTLDDYEEGTWTIGVSFGGASVDVTTSSNTGTYTKVGRKVTVNGILVLTSKGTSTGNALITGLPEAIASGNSNFCTASLRLVNVSFANQFQAVGNTNSTTILLNEITEAGTFTTLTDANFANNSTLVVSLTYFTT